MISRELPAMILFKCPLWPAWLPIALESSSVRKSPIGSKLNKYCDHREQRGGPNRPPPHIYMVVFGRGAAAGYSQRYSSDIWAGSGTRLEGRASRKEGL